MVVPEPEPGLDADADGFTLDIVGVGALNLDYIAHASSVARGWDASTTSRIAEVVARSGARVESGADSRVDEHTMRSVLELAAEAAPPSTVLGGSAFNAVHAVAAAGAGLSLGYVGVAGRAPVSGISVLGELERLGVDTRNVLDDPRNMCGVCFSFAEDGERTLLTHAGANARMAEHLAESSSRIADCLARARIVHVTCFADDDTAGALLDVLRAVRAGAGRGGGTDCGTRISFDPGHLWSTDRSPEIEGLLSLSDYLLVNHREFRELAGPGPGATDDAAAANLLGRLRSEQPAVLVKRPHGVHAYRIENGVQVGEFHSQTPLAPGEIEDATGAGDVFAAGLLTVLARRPQDVGGGVRLGMRMARHKLRHVGSRGTRYAAVLREFTASDQRRRMSFGARAEAYERFRPGYPVELFDTVLAYAGRPVREALEIGAGTGKATRLFAQRGVGVTATEPDGAMLAELRKRVPASARTVRAAFEDLRPDGRYGLVYAAAALHWTEPEGRWSRVAALLEPGGVFASFGGPIRLADPAVEQTVRAARAPFLESDEVPSPDGTPPGDDMQWPGTELRGSEWFTGVQQSVTERRLTMSALDYVGYLSTISAYLVLPASEQEQVFDRIMRVLPETVELAADVTVHLARRRYER